MRLAYAGAAFLALHLVAGGRATGPQDAQRLRPDAALQSLLARLTDAPTAAEQQATLAALRASPPEVLVPQLFLFSTSARDTREGMLLGFVLAELDLPPAEVVRALVPLLESDEPDLRAEVGNVLSAFEDRDLERGADFGVYRAYCTGPEPLPEGLARHLFEVDPLAALRALAQAELHEPAELRALLWAAHELADVTWKLRRGFRVPAELARTEPEALEQLALLARHPRWWARLGAARIAAEEPALRAVVAPARLERDAHPLVRAAAGAWR